MANILITDDEFIRAWQEAGCSPRRMSEMTGMQERQVYARRHSLAGRGIILQTKPTGTSKGNWSKENVGRAYKNQNTLRVDTGNVLIFSDAHWWPDHERTTANEALHELIKALKPVAIVANGDLFDGARVSRHAPLGWSELPSVRGELEICQERLADIEMILPKGCARFWNIGNHDARFDRALVTNAPEYEGLVERLEDKFDRWDFAWSLTVNDNIMIKHRYHNGIHAAYNNALKSGKTIVTGHLHRLAVTPWADYNGRRWGVDTGTLANPHGPQFDYAENNPSPHTSGFAVLTFKDGMLLPPELVEVIDEKAYFRGECIYNGASEDGNLGN
jgi:UDP-2,3-diacylglucosamine pyrophosphatase LpxH